MVTLQTRFDDKVGTIDVGEDDEASEPSAETLGRWLHIAVLVLVAAEVRVAADDLVNLDVVRPELSLLGGMDGLLGLDEEVVRRRQLWFVRTYGGKVEGMWPAASDCGDGISVDLDGIHVVERLAVISDYLQIITGLN
jgi:hypothetical protein